MSTVVMESFAVDSSVTSQQQWIDRKAGILRNVKVQGIRSRNRRRYSEQALAEAVPLYEGAQVFVDHSIDPDSTRSTNDLIGHLKNVRFKPGKGIYGDCVLLKSHPTYERLIEVAEKMPTKLGFSHNVDGDTHTEDGELVVDSIVEVRSVDLVTDPATNNGLFESVQRRGKKVKKKIRMGRYWDQLCESLQPSQRKTIKRLREGGDLDDDREMMVEMDGEDMGDAMAAEPGSALREGFRAEIESLIDAWLDGDQEAGKRVAELARTHAKLSPEEEPEEIVEMDDEEEVPVEDEVSEPEMDDEGEMPLEDEEEMPLDEEMDYEDEDEPLEECDEENPVPKMESYQKRVSQAMKLMESHQVSADSVLLESLLRCETRPEMERLLKREKTMLRENRDWTPRTAATGRVNGEQIKDVGSMSGAELADFLRGN